MVGMLCLLPWAVCSVLGQFSVEMKIIPGIGEVDQRGAACGEVDQGGAADGRLQAAVGGKETIVCAGARCFLLHSFE